jgi:hypothetical protein
MNNDVDLNNNNQTNLKPLAATTIAYVVSFIECTDHHKSGQSSIAGLIDASLVLRHSIHMNSISSGKSKYDYKVYALIHRTKAASCSPALQQAGFTTVLVDPPIQQSDIKGDELRKKIHREVCCGADEFIKLYAYTHFTEPLVVHLDIDFLFTKPMDPLFDIMLSNDPVVVEKAKRQIHREDPTDTTWPTNIDAMITRDYHSSFGQGRPSGFQAGFWLVKPNQQHFDNLMGIIRDGNYTSGFGRDNGWVRTKTMSFRAKNKDVLSLSHTYHNIIFFCFNTGWIRIRWICRWDGNAGFGCILL